MKNYGYSLVEIIIVVTIIVLFTGLGVASYSRFTAQQEVDGETNVILNLLETARSKSINRDLDQKSFLNCEPFGGYKLKIDKTTQKYLLSVQCGADGNYDAIRSFPMKATVGINAPVAEITFEPDTGNVSSCADQNCIITIDNVTADRCKQITIPNIGGIEAKDCP